MKRLALLVLGPMLVVAAWGVAPAAAQSNTGNDNAAVAQNTKDGSFVFKFAFQVTHVAGDVVAPSNAAVAAASCSYCETVAVAIQVVLVSGSPDTVAPSNVAIAYNQDCYECTTVADAFQFVFSTGSEPVHLTKEGKEQLKAIQKEFKDLQKNGAALSPAELQSRVDALAQRVYQVYSTQLVPKGQGGNDQPSSSSASPTTTPSTSPPTTSPTSSPSSTVAPSPTTTVATTSPTAAPAGSSTTTVAG